MLAQLRAHLAGAAEAEELDLVAARQQRVQRAKVVQQARRGLAADPGDAGNVVDRIAAQREVIGHLVRVHAVAGLHPRSGPALAAGEIPLAVLALKQLGQVLVGRHDDAGESTGATGLQRAADQVVGLVVVVGQHRQAHHATQGLAVRELATQLVRRGRAIGLVRRIEPVAEAAVERLVERDGDVPRSLALDQLGQEAGEAVDRVGRPAVRVAEFVRHRMPGAKDVETGVDQVQRCHTGIVTPCAPGVPGWDQSGRQSLSSACGSGRSRSGASTRGVPMWMKPTMRS